MAGFFQSFEVADLALGKPALYWLPISATVGDAQRMLKELNVSELSVWHCAAPHHPAVLAPKHLDSIPETRSTNRKRECGECECVGRVNLLDTICYFAREDKVHNLEAASKDPISVLLPSSKRHIRHIALHARLTEAFNLILDGAQYLIVPLDTRRNNRCSSMKSSAPKKVTLQLQNSSSNEKYSRLDFCWLTHEDVLRFMLGCIGVFSPLPMINIQELGIINREIMFLDVNAKASEVLNLINLASQQMSAVAILEGQTTSSMKLVGDISLASLRDCDESAAFVLATLSASDFLTFTQDPNGASKLMKELIISELEKSFKLKLNNVTGLLLNSSSSSSTSSMSSTDGTDDDSSDEMWEVSSTEENSNSNSSSTTLDALCSDSKRRKSGSYVRSSNSGASFVCHPWSSLVAVIAQALAYRTSYLWVTDSENSVIGIITYVDILRVLLNHLLSFQ